MFQTIAACIEGLQNLLNSHAAVQDPVDIKDIVARFTTDIIGSCGFGLECNSLKDPNSEFRRYGKRVFEPNTYENIKFMLYVVCPRRILKFFHMTITNKNVSEFFTNTVKEIVRYRETNNVKRKDFMDLMLQLKKEGQLSDDGTTGDKSDDANNKIDRRLTFNELAAQCFVFFLAGYETSSSTMTFALLELAQNQHIQDKLRIEINTILKNHDGELSYDAIMEMMYLDKVVLGK